MPLYLPIVKGNQKLRKTSAPTASNIAHQTNHKPDFPSTHRTCFARSRYNIVHNRQGKKCFWRSESAVKKSKTWRWLAPQDHAKKTRLLHLVSCQVLFFFALMIKKLHSHDSCVVLISIHLTKEDRVVLSFNPLKTTTVHVSSFFPFSYRANEDYKEVVYAGLINQKILYECTHFFSLPKGSFLQPIGRASQHGLSQCGAPKAFVSIIHVIWHLY